MKRPIIPSSACLSYAQYAVETKRTLCKMSESGRISARILFMSIFITKSNNSGIKTIPCARVISDFDDLPD